MKERAIDQFEALFERASIPVLDIDEIRLRRLSLVLADNELDASLIALAKLLRERFQLVVHVHWPRELASCPIESRASLECVPAVTGFESAAALIGQIALVHSQLVLLADAELGGTQPGRLDELVAGTAPPVMVLRQPVEKAAAVFANILHSLSGNFRQTSNFAYSFTLVDDRGRLRLLHVVDQADVTAVREALQVAGDVSNDDEREVLERLTHHGERYLKAVVAASRDLPYEVSYCLRRGEIVAVTQQELTAGDYGLLVVGHHEEGHSHITAADYQLMHLVRNVPVLAL